MTKTIIVKNRTVTLYTPNVINGRKPLPVVYFNAPADDARDLWYACLRKECPRFNLVVISNLDWDGDLTPWPSPALNPRDRACAGKADEYLKELCEFIIPAAERQLPQPVSCRILAGYSLSGLFALYAFYHTTLFDDMISCSGSFWYPGFLDYAKSHPLAKKPQYMYFSLGNTEARTGNPKLKDVQTNTVALVKYFEHLGIHTDFVLNSGNHFQDPYGRIAMGIHWLLSTAHKDAREAREAAEKQMLPAVSPESVTSSQNASQPEPSAAPDGFKPVDPAAADGQNAAVNQASECSDPQPPVSR